MDIDLYIDSSYCGFYPASVIEDFFEDYKQEAAGLLDEIEDDEVILYAVYTYSSDSEKIISANFVCYRMNYLDLVDSCQSLSDYYRLFYLKRTKGGYYEKK